MGDNHQKALMSDQLERLIASQQQSMHLIHQFESSVAVLATPRQSMVDKVYHILNTPANIPTQRTDSSAQPLYHETRNHTEPVLQERSVSERSQQQMKSRQPQPIHREIGTPRREAMMGTSNEKHMEQNQHNPEEREWLREQKRAAAKGKVAKAAAEKKEEKDSGSDSGSNSDSGKKEKKKKKEKKEKKKKKDSVSNSGSNSDSEQKKKKEKKEKKEKKNRSSSKAAVADEEEAATKAAAAEEEEATTVSESLAQRVPSSKQLRYFRNIDKNRNGSVELVELQAKLTEWGMSAEEIEALTLKIDTDGDNKISQAEFVAQFNLFLNQCWRMPPELDKKLTAIAAQYAHLGEGEFTDLTRAGGCEIADTARRAISLEQLDLLAAHMIRRVANNREKWTVKRFPDGGGKGVDHCIKSAYEVNLYDVCAHVIGPCTEELALSMVELMSEDGIETDPDYFWWGEIILQFLACLHQHCHDRMLRSARSIKGGDNKSYLGEDRSPRYWVCAYANNQWKLNQEISGRLEETSFCRAMQLSRGTVSVIDPKGTYFSRIWCVYELEQSLIKSNEDYTFDMYTAVLQHTYKYRNDEIVSRSAVGITDGVTPYDTVDYVQTRRQAHFPLEVLEAAVVFKSRQGEAARPEDKEKILSSIGDGHEQLDNLVHGVMARAGLARVLMSNGPGEQQEQFVRALATGKVRELVVGFQSVPAEHQTEEALQSIVEAVDPATIETLTLKQSKAGGNWLSPLVGLKFEKLKTLDLRGNEHLQSLPHGVFDGMGELQRLVLTHCRGLQSLPEGVFDQLAKLEKLDLSNCTGLQSLPNGVFDQLPKLEWLEMASCKGLQSLSEDVFDLLRLKELYLRDCPAAKSLPRSVITRLEANGCKVYTPAARSISRRSSLARNVSS